MRKLIVTSMAATALFAAAAVTAPRAHALTATAPAGLAGAVQQSSPVQEVATVCRRVWRCQIWGCGWQRACWWQPRRHWSTRRHHHPWWGWNPRRNYYWR